MNLANVYNHISKAYELSVDSDVLSNLQFALTEISTHMDKEKERVKKYRAKDYVPHACVTDDSGRCKMCGTPLETLSIHTKVKAKIVSPTKPPVPLDPIPSDPMADALALLDTPMPVLHHDGVMDDLEEDAPPKPTTDEVFDDLDSILGL